MPATDDTLIAVSVVLPACGRALQRFPIDRFSRDWDAALRQVTGFSVTQEQG